VQGFGQEKKHIFGKKGQSKLFFFRPLGLYGLQEKKAKNDQRPGPEFKEAPSK
jgi:hypothetical protein